MFTSSHLYHYLCTPTAGGPGSLKPEPSPYNPGMYGSNFNSQRTSLESNSDYSAYLSANSNNFITPDMVDNRQRDHSLKGSISRSMSGYTHSTIPPDAPRQSRSFSGFPSPSPSPSDTIILGEQNSFSGSMPKSDPFGQFVGFGPIGSGSGSSIPSPGFKNGSMYDRGPDSYSSEVSTTEDGLESMRDPTGHYLMPQYRDRERERDKDGGGHGHGDYMNRNLGPSGEHSAYRDQFHDGVRSSVSRSSSFDSTLDSLNSYKHISVGPEDDHPIRRGAFVLRDPYGTPGINTAAPNSHAFPMHHTQQHLMQQGQGQGQGQGKPFDIRRSNPNVNVSLQDVRECLEEDNSHDFASHDASSPGPGTIKMIRRSDTDPGSLSFSHLGMNNNSNINTNSNGSFDQSRGDASTGALDGSTVSYSGMAPSSSHSVGSAVPGASIAESNEHSNIDSYHPDMRGGSNLSSFDNESINFNNGIINRHDIVINNDDSSTYPGNGSKYYFDSNGHNSNPVPCSSSLSTPNHIHFGAANGNGNGGGSNSSGSGSGGSRAGQGQREGGGEQLSDYDNNSNSNTNKAGYGLSIGMGGADTSMGRSNGNNNGFRSPGNGHGHGQGGSLGPKSVGSDGSQGQGQGHGQGVEEDMNKEDEERMPFSRRPSSALSEPTADYLQDDFTLLTTDTQTFIPLDKWMIKVWLHIVFSGFDSDIIEGFISKLRDDGGFVTVQVCFVVLCYTFT